MTDAIQSAMAAHVWAGLLLVFVMAWLEYVFPPVPGDSTILFGFFLAAASGRTLLPVAAAAIGGSVLGSLTACALGRRLGGSYFFLRSAWAKEELARLERWFSRLGPGLLIVNRFIPGLRGLFLYAAGIGRVGVVPVAVYSTISNVLWVALLGFCATRVGTSWEEVRVVFRRYVWGIAFFLGIYLVVSFVRARRRRRRMEVRPSS
jgi:membrane protein DedA with SNARE-associated domain